MPHAPIHFPVQVASNVPLSEFQSVFVAEQCVAALLNMHPDGKDLDHVVLEVAIDGGLLVLFVDADCEIFAALHQAPGTPLVSSVDDAGEIDWLRGCVQ
ncbi:hypothetical protein PPMP20_38070 [Paraburkholderia phymatum]|nr:hypothetical protein [Paraburkholderia phymatum]